jgi:glycosyltransferase involved in cell wall biosynthesis
MKILVLVDNNLKYDNRIKRHITAMLEEGHEVTAIACCADAEPGFTAPGLEMILWNPVPYMPDAHVIRSLAARLRMEQEIFAAYPAALATAESMDVLAPLTNDIQQRQLACSCWKPFDPICLEGVPPAQAHSQTLSDLQLMLLWAEYVVGFEADCIYCNDLPALLPGVVHKKRHGSRLIFDAHEVYYDLAPGLQPRLWKQSMALLERQLALSGDVIFGVSQSHVDWMRTAYNPPAEMVLVPNCVGLGQEITQPRERTPHTPLRVYYHGAGDRFRGLDNIVEAIADVPAAEFIMRCMPSPDLCLVDEAIARTGLRDRVRRLPVVGPASIIDAVRAEADIGIHAHALPQALNIKVCLSNKFIEYLLAGIPIITSPLEEQARVVRQHDIGYVLADNSPQEIRRGLNWAVENRHRFSEMGQRAFEIGTRTFAWKSIRANLMTALN